MLLERIDDYFKQYGTKWLTTNAFLLRKTEHMMDASFTNPDTLTCYQFIC